MINTNLLSETINSLIEKETNLVSNTELNHIEKPYFDAWANSNKELNSFTERRAARLGWQARSLFRPDNAIVIIALQEQIKTLQQTLALETVRREIAEENMYESNGHTANAFIRALNEEAKVVELVTTLDCPHITEDIK